MKKGSNNFITNVIKLVTGNLFAQGLTVLLLPILSRLFAPEAFGVSALFLSLANLIGILACLRYEQAIMLPKSDTEAANLLGLCFVIVVLSMGLSTVCIFFVTSWIATILKTPELASVLWLIPIAIGIEGLFFALYYWNSRSRHFGRLSIAQASASLISNMIRLGCGFAGLVSGTVLILAQVAGQSMSALVLGMQIWRDDRVFFKSSMRWPKMMEGFKRYWKFPAFNTWSILLNTASIQLPTWLLAMFFSPTIVGFYALGSLVLAVPMRFVGTSIAQVFYQKASETYANRHDLSKVFSDVSSRLVALGIFPLLMLTCIGKDFFIIVFGQRWADAGLFVQILGVTIFFQFITSPLMHLFSVLEYQGTNLLFNIMLFVARAGALVIGGLLGNVKLALLLYALAGIAYYSLFYGWVFSTLRMPPGKLLRPLLKYGTYCAPWLGIAVVFKLWMGLHPLWVVGIGCLSSIPYYAIVLQQDRILQQPIRLIFQRVGLIK